jgi:putative transposase
MMHSMKTWRFRIKDKHARALDAMACEVNLVWNFVNDLSSTHTRRTGKFFSAYDMAKYTAGASREGLQIHSQTVQGITEEYVTRRKQFKKCKLRWRVSRGNRKSLGWIPFKAGATTYKNGQLRYAGQFFGVWDSYGLADYKLRSGSFSQDARGRWYANLCVEVATEPLSGTAEIGIDLGLKDFAVMSDGSKVEAQRLQQGAAGQDPARKNSQPQERLPAQTEHPARQRQRCHLRSKRERERSGKNQDGEVRPGRGLVVVPNHAAVQKR